MKIAILGATSQIFKELAYSWLMSNKTYELYLYSRDTSNILNHINFSKCHDWYSINDLAQFELTDIKFDAIINFIGVGDPAKLISMGVEILHVTKKYDDQVMLYLDKNPNCRYIFMSSGAVYGSSFFECASVDTCAIIPINNVTSKDFYSVAKLYSEIIHRANSDKYIVDVRVFNLFGRFQDLNARFFIAEAVSSIVKGNVLSVNADTMIRDYIHPSDFCNLIDLILHHNEHLNVAVDCYSKAPVDKMELLFALEDRFGLKWCVNENANTLNASGSKNRYYSINTIAETIGYEPKYSSLNSIINEVEAILNQLN